MTQDEMQELEREANGLYQAGEYHRAREVWQQILESDPENSRAAEGVRMAALLSENWNFFAQEGGEEEVSLQSGLDRVLRMTQGGDFEGAFRLLQELDAEFPDAESLEQARQEVQNAYEMAPFVNEQLRTAQEKLDAGELDEARAACAKVLALDPANRNARMMQEQIEFGTARPGESPDATEGGELPDLELLELEEVDETSGGDVGELPPPDLTFDAGPPPDQVAVEESTGAPRPDPAPPAGLDGGDTERFLALVEEGHHALDQSRYQDAIELLSHALAMDENHEGAARLLERARREQAESHRVADAKLIEAMDFFDHGRHEEAAPLFRQVLDAIPDHHSAREYLAEIEKAGAQAAPAPEEGAEPLDQPPELPELGSAESGADLAGISPGEVVLDRGGADEVSIAGASEVEPLVDPEEADEFLAETDLTALEGFSDLDEVAGEIAPRRSGRPLMVVAVLLLVGAGVAGWFYRDRIMGLFAEGGDEAILSHEQRAALAPPDGGEAKTEAQILEMIEEAANGSAQSGPEANASSASEAEPTPLTVADLGRLLDDARSDVRAGRGREALATLKVVLELDEGNQRVAEIQKPARLIVTARDGFAGGEYEDSLRALYRLDSQVDPSLRPVAVGRWLDNTRWNFLLSNLQDQQPWRVLDLTHPSRGELQLRGGDRDAVQPLIEMARRWQYESAREFARSGYQSEVNAFTLRSFDE